MQAPLPLTPSVHQKAGRARYHRLPPSIIGSSQHLEDPRECKSTPPARGSAQDLAAQSLGGLGSGHHGGVSQWCSVPPPLHPSSDPIWTPGQNLDLRWPPFGSDGSTYRPCDGLLGRAWPVIHTASAAGVQGEQLLQGPRSKMSEPGTRARTG